MCRGHQQQTAWVAPAALEVFVAGMAEQMRLRVKDLAVEYSALELGLLLMALWLEEAILHQRMGTFL